MGKIVNGFKLRVGDRVKVINATMGALGANGEVGTIVEYNGSESNISGLKEFRDSTIVVKLDEPSRIYGTRYWRVGKSGSFELLSSRKSHMEVDVIIKDDITKVVIGDKIGVSRCKEEDTFNEAYGVILAVASAYNLDKEKRTALIDALYDGVKTLEDYDSEELLDELKSRVVD